ncbi:hypothetical protein [Micromonospora sp. WMMD736]|uniref:hypothetical protein n=1 Tax=Micromonospora sp. WMMD736 TaxID=3404112 RepID=UPI003B94B100
MKDLVEHVSVDLDHEGGEGWMFVHPDASADEIRDALALVDEAGFEELDPDETGDEFGEDEQGRYMVPLARKGGW